jgi:cytochrome c biogenesis protein CcdA
VNRSRFVKGLTVAMLVALALSAWTAPFARAAVPTAPTDADSTPIIYYYTEGCSECRAVEQYLEVLSAQYDFYLYKKVDSLDGAGAKVRSALDATYGVADAERGVAPTIFVGDRVFIREPAIKAGLEQALKSSTPELRQHLLDAEGAAENGGGDDPADLFKTFSVLTVVGAGLLDGVNPCAFATLIFFISYLIIRSKARRDILFVGLAFAAGVFLAYLAAGMGLYQVVSRVPWFFALSKWFYLAIGVFAAVIAVLSVRDAWRARHGDLGDMTLQLPERNKGIIHRLIRDQARTGFVVTSAFLVAFPVSLFEFMCTGQTYLPTIVLIFSQSVLKQRAALFLIIYNLLFILPLVLITVIAYLGVTSDHLVTWLKKNAAPVKAATAVLFVALAGFLIVRALTLFGVIR